jgi:Tol biopolymer transport system component
MRKNVNSLLGATLPLLAIFGSPTIGTAQTFPDTRILYSADVTDRRTKQTTHHIFVMNADASGQAQLTSGSASSAFPAWSHDKRYILFHRSTPSENTIYIMDAVGERNGGRIFPVASNGGDSGVDWAPNDSMIVFSGTIGTTDGLWIVAVNPDSGEVGTPTLVRAGPSAAPAWSPDGTKVAFVSYPGPTIKVLDLATGAESFGVGGYGPSFSPDGSMIAFSAPGPVTTTKGGKTTTTWYYEVFVANADGTGIQQLTTLQTDLVGFPKWSADATQIAFRNKVSGVNYVYKLTLGSGALTRLTQGATLDWNP